MEKTREEKKYERKESGKKRDPAELIPISCICESDALPALA